MSLVPGVPRGGKAFSADVPALPVPAVVLDTLDSLTEERDRARRVAIALEQELARYYDRHPCRYCKDDLP